MNGPRARFDDPLPRQGSRGEPQKLNVRAEKKKSRGWRSP